MLLILAIVGKMLLATVCWVINRKACHEIQIVEHDFVALTYCRSINWNNYPLTKKIPL